MIDLHLTRFDDFSSFLHHSDAFSKACSNGAKTIKNPTNIDQSQIEKLVIFGDTIVLADLYLVCFSSRSQHEQKKHRKTEDSGRMSMDS